MLDKPGYFFVGGCLRPFTRVAFNIPVHQGIKPTGKYPQKTFVLSWLYAKTALVRLFIRREFANFFAPVSFKWQFLLKHYGGVSCNRLPEVTRGACPGFVGVSVWMSRWRMSVSDGL